MKWKRALPLLGTLVLLASLVPLPAAGAAPSWQSAIEKIEPRLLDKVNAEGKADFIVWMAEKADLSGVQQLESKEAKGAFVFQALRVTAERTQRPLLDYLDRHGVRYQSFYIANKVLVRGGDLALLMDIAARTDVAQVLADHSFQVDRPIVRKGWFARTEGVEPNLTFIRADQVWALGITGRGTVLAGNDSGLDETHPAIARHYRGCLNPPLCTSWDHDYNWWDASGAYPDNPTDRLGEGTHTTGTMVGDDGGENRIGVAPGAQTIHCKNMDDTGGTFDSWIIDCFQWDLAPWNLGGQNPRPDLAPDVVNTSWGYWGGNYPLFQDEINALQSAGILVEAAAGNEGPFCGTLRSPGDYTQVLTTGSVDHDIPFPGVITDDTWSSSRGPSAIDPSAFSPSVMAPGHNIRSALPNGSYDYWSSTAMAGSHAVGVVGLMWSANPGLRGRVEETNRLIAATAGRLVGQGGSGCGGDYTNGPNNDWGYGTVDALAAVQAAVHYGNTGALTGTVRDAATGLPIAGATVQASLDPALVWSADTGEAGIYTLHAFSGAYTVYASHYGYLPVALPGLAVFSEMTTSQDISLSVAPSTPLYGYVTDDAAGWPLYARIDIDGYPGSPIWTDPATGFYSVSLAVGPLYHLTVNSEVPGYQQSSRDVGPLSGPQGENFALRANPSSCSAPGYGWTTAYTQDWEAGDGGFTVGGTNPSWQLGALPGDRQLPPDNVPPGGPGSAHSGANAWGTELAGNYADGEDSWIESPDLDLSSLAGTGITISWWQWLQTESCCDWAVVEISNDGGSTWGAAYQGEGDVDRNWTHHSLLLDSSYAVPNFRVRFRLHSDGSATFPGWYVDDLAIAGNCHPGSISGGLVVGVVADSSTGRPLAGAIVSSDSGRSTVARATEDPMAGGAFYALFSPAGAHVVTTTVAGYNNGVRAVDVVTGAAVREAFALTSGHLNLTPLSMDVSLDMGTRVTIPVTLANAGDGSASFAVGERDRGFWRDAQTSLSIPPSDGNFALGTAPTSIGPAPTARPSAGSAVKGVEGLPGAHAYAIDLARSNIVSLQSDDPESWSIAGEVATTSSYAGAFVQGNSSRLYVVDSGGAFWAWNTVTAQATRIGTLAPLAGETWTGLAGAPDGTLYASSTNIGRSTLYTVDPDTGEATLVGEITNAPAIIDIAVNAAGDMYGLDIANDVLVRIDPETGAGTIVGWVGFDANYAQGMDFEKETGSLYLAAYNNNTDQGELRLCDPATGNSTLIGAFPEGAEVDAFAFAPGDLAELPWLGEALVSGTILAGAVAPVTVTLDVGAVNLPGKYRAALVVENDTPYGSLSVPITMTVVAPPSYGRLAGTVTGMGYCDADPAPIKKAAVTVRGSSGKTWNLLTDNNGAYELWLDQAETPVTVTVSAPEHEPGLQAGIAVAGQQTTVVNIAQRWRKPCAAAEPAALSAELEWGQNTTLPLTLINAGAGEMHYQLRQEDMRQSLTRTIPLSDGAAPVSWLAADPPTGTIPAGGQASVAVTLDAAAVGQPGSYRAVLRVVGDGRADGDYPVFITMTVQPRADMGRLAGRVIDRCNGAPLTATVTISGGDPITRTETSDDGDYAVWQPAGSYDVALTADGYRPHTDTLQVAAGQTKTLDAALVPERPCAAATPVSFDVRVVSGTATYTGPVELRLANVGGQDLTYRVAEISGSVELGRSPTGGVCQIAVTAGNGTDPAETIQLHRTLTKFGYRWMDVDSIQEARDAGAATLLVRFAGSPGISVDDLDEWMNDGHGVIQLGDGAPWVPTAWESAASGTPLHLTVADGNHPLTRGLPPSWTGTGYLAYSWEGADALGWATDSSYPDLIEGRYTVSQPRAVTAAEHGAGRIAYIGINVYGSLAGPADRQLLKNAIGWTGNCAAEGVPWLVATPVTGTIPAQSTASIDLIFTALYTDGAPLPPGSYTATLLISSNDRQTGTLRTPVVMHVVGEAVYSVYLPVVTRGVAP